MFFLLEWVLSKPWVNTLPNFRSSQLSSEAQVKSPSDLHLNQLSSKYRIHYFSAVCSNHKSSFINTINKVNFTEGLEGRSNECRACKGDHKRGDHFIIESNKSKLSNQSTVAKWSELEANATLILYDIWKMEWVYYIPNTH